MMLSDLLHDQRFFAFLGEGAWALLTQAALPATAIFASAMLALYLQRKDHARQDREREALVMRERAYELRRQHEKLVEFEYEIDRHLQDASAGLPQAQFIVVSRWTETLTAWTSPDDPLQTFIGLWIFAKRLEILTYIQKTGDQAGPRVVTTTQMIFRMQTELRHWLAGSKTSDWFFQDAMKLDPWQGGFGELEKKIREIRDGNLIQPAGPR